MSENEQALFALRRLQYLSLHLPKQKNKQKEQQELAEAVFDYIEAEPGNLYEKAVWCENFILQGNSLQELISVLEREVDYDIDYQR
jgi:hypothetical protein